MRNEVEGPPALIKEVLDASRVGGYGMPTLTRPCRKTFDAALTHLEALSHTALAAAAAATGLAFDDLAALLDRDPLPFRECRSDVGGLGSLVDRLTRFHLF